MKKLWHSRTFWLAVAQAIVSVLVVVFTELDLVGYATLLKSLADVYLRVDTTEPVSV